MFSMGFPRILNVPVQYSSIQDGLNEALPTDTVMVAPGIYTENLQWPDVESINLMGNSPESTIIDGNLTGSVITIVSNESTSINSNTILSGFTIKNGRAYSTYPEDRGGGIILINASPMIKDVVVEDCNAAFGGGIAVINSNPYLENVTITGNNSLNSGGGIYCDNSSPMFEQCSLTDNTAETYGGGIYCIDDSSPVINNSDLSNNVAETGGGLSSFDSSHPQINICIISNNIAFRGGGTSSFFDSNPVFYSVQISNNSADSTGGGVYSAYGKPSFVDCNISENSAKVGGGISIGSNDTPEFINTEITENTAVESGGGIYLFEVNPDINNVTVSGNFAQFGGGIYMENSNSTLSNLKILENNADYGGGMFFINSDPVILHSEITQNSAVSGAGIFSNYYSNLELSFINLAYNEADTYGGGINLEQGSTTIIENSLIHHNSAPIYGGGIYAWDEAEFRLINLTVVDNFSNAGGAVTALAESNGIIVNSILWNNGIAEIYSNNSNVNLFYSNNETGWQGEKNLRIDPSFQDNVIDSYLLNFDSKCIDKGTDFFITGNDTLINLIAGSYNGEKPDMGAYEYFGSIGDLNGDGQINMIDLVQVIFIIINNEELNDLEIQLADFNGDGYVTVLDVILLMEMILNS